MRSARARETRHGQNETGLVVGRKNWLFAWLDEGGSRSRRGTEVAAVFYTLLETAKLVGVDPARYLREAALADARGDVLLPADVCS
jgi:transposase